METFSVLLAICAGNSPVPGEFPAQRPVTRSFDVFFDLRLNKRLSKQSWGWWFETLSHPLWRHRNLTQPDESQHRTEWESLAGGTLRKTFGWIVSHTFQFFRFRDVTFDKEDGVLPICFAEFRHCFLTPGRVNISYAYLQRELNQNPLTRSFLFCWFLIKFFSWLVLLELMVICISYSKIYCSITDISGELGQYKNSF